MVFFHVPKGSQVSEAGSGVAGENWHPRGPVGEFPVSDPLRKTLAKSLWDPLRENSCEVAAQNTNIETSPGSQASIFLGRGRTPPRDSSREFALHNLHWKLG